MTGDAAELEPELNQKTCAGIYESEIEPFHKFILALVIDLLIKYSMVEYLTLFLKYIIYFMLTLEICNL